MANTRIIMKLLIQLHRILLQLLYLQKPNLFQVNPKVIMPSKIVNLLSRIFTLSLNLSFMKYKTILFIYVQTLNLLTSVHALI